MILYRNVSFSRRKSTTNFGGPPFFRGKVTIFIGRVTNTHFTDENQRFFCNRSALPTIIIVFDIYEPFNNNNRRLSQACSFFVRRPSAGSTSQALPSGESSDDCARGGDTSSSRSLRPWPRVRTTQPGEWVRAEAHGEVPSRQYHGLDDEVVQMSTFCEGSQGGEETAAPAAGGDQQQHSMGQILRLLGRPKCFSGREDEWYGWSLKVGAETATLSDHASVWMSGAPKLSSEITLS